jgi:hypothetical protein
VDELGQARSRLVEHTQRAVAGAHQFHGGGHDGPQHDGQVQVLLYQEHSADEGLEPLDVADPVKRHL